MWRIPEPLLEQAQDDATVVAIRDMERAGIDIISDGRDPARELLLRLLRDGARRRGCGRARGDQ
jgi:hypothetical protein